MTSIDFVKFPKVALHDHLDGGLRPGTLLELGHTAGVTLPADRPDSLAKVIADRANSGTLTGYLETFAWSVGAMQSAEALERVAREAVEDLASDGVVLAELRFAPLLHMEAGLTAQEVIDAVTRGLGEGTRLTGLPAGLILCALRHRDEAELIVDLFERNRLTNELVIGIDLAGPEKGFPVEGHPAISILASRLKNAPITIHAGEAAGVDSIRGAIEAGARRIGHGTRLIDDILGDRELVSAITSRGILIEVCLSSNCQTGATTSLLAHPLKRFISENLKVNLDSDNRLVSATKHSDEVRIAHEKFGLSFDRLVQVAKDSINASFMPLDAKQGALAKLEAFVRLID